MNKPARGSIYYHPKNQEFYLIKDVSEDETNDNTDNWTVTYVILGCWYATHSMDCKKFTDGRFEEVNIDTLTELYKHRNKDYV